MTSDPKIVAERWAEGWQRSMAAIRRTDERVSIDCCPGCGKAHSNQKVRYDRYDRPFVTCGRSGGKRFDLDQRWKPAAD
jgi:hypothetical protein